MHITLFVKEIKSTIQVVQYLDVLVCDVCPEKKSNGVLQSNKPTEWNQVILSDMF